MNVPVYQLLGGASRDRVLVYAHANGKTLDDTVAAVAHHQALGYKAIRAQCGIPGVEHAYGIAKGDAPYEPAEKGRPLETVWSTEAYLSFVPSVFERLRREFGSDLHLLHDVHHRLTPIEAGRLGQALEPYRLFWMEDPVPAELQESFRLIRQHTTTPIAVGEVFNSIFDCHLLIEEQLIDYIRTTVTHAGGISHLRKIAALAELHHVRTGSHGATDLSPVCMAAALHFDLSVHNFGIQEHMPHAADHRSRVSRTPIRYQDGYMHPGDAPGLGVDIDEVAGGDVPLRAGLPAGRSQAGWHSAFVVRRQVARSKDPPAPRSREVQRPGATVLTDVGCVLGGFRTRRRQGLSTSGFDNRMPIQWTSPSTNSSNDSEPASSRSACGAACRAPRRPRSSPTRDSTGS